MPRKITATIVIPPNSRALRQDIEAAARVKWPHVEFTFCDGNIDSHCRVSEMVGFEGPALAEHILREVKRIEHKYC